HSSSTCAGRAFSAGKEPTTPALHWAMTRSGLERMNIGEQTTGIDRPCRMAGRDMVTPFGLAGRAGVGVERLRVAVAGAPGTDYLERNFMPSSRPCRVSGYMRSSTSSRMMLVELV